MKKCFYCGTKKEMFLTVAKPKCENLRKYKYCSEDCVNKTNGFMKLINRTKKLFWAGISTSILLCILGIVLSSFFLTPSLVILTLSIFLLGLTLIIFPIPTPEVLSMLGIKKTMVLVRIIGTILMMLSPLCLIVSPDNISDRWMRVGEQLQNLF